MTPIVNRCAVVVVEKVVEVAVEEVVVEELVVTVVVEEVFVTMKDVVDQVVGTVMVLVVVVRVRVRVPPAPGPPVAWTSTSRLVWCSGRT